MESSSHLPAYRTNGRASGLNGIRRIGLFFFIALAIASLAFFVPFLRPIRYSWAEMNFYLQASVFLFSAALFCHACLIISLPNALRLFGFSIFFSYVAESLGIRWAGMFGSQYSYNPALLPRMPGGVPVFILLMWFVLAYMALGFLYPLSIRPKGSPSWRRFLLKSALGGLFIAAADFSLDPFGTSSGMWSWREPGGYFGTPFHNFGTWFLIGLVICGSYLLLEEPPPENNQKEGVVLNTTFVIISLSITTLFFAACLNHQKSGLPVALSFLIISPYWAYRTIFI